MDDVDAVQAQIARNMLDSGDWVSARLNGVLYLEKSPLVYWLMALSYSIFGAHDWAARLPIALAAIALCWLTCRFGVWAFSPTAGLYSGLVLATSVGLFLFTRILIPDVILTLTITLAMWAFLRALDDQEPHAPQWALAFWASMGAGLLLKGLIAVLFPVAAAGLYLLATKQLFARRTWRALRPLAGASLALLIAAPWHILATLRNPPYLDFTFSSGPGNWRGFFWFYFLNEHVLRFLNLRYPRDYNTVPRVAFWLFHLLWLFPWSALLPAVATLNYRPTDRAGRTRLLALCWTGFLLAFFTFSTTQEYYSMPCYPALALLLGCAMAAGGRAITIGTRVVAAIATLAAVAIGFIWWQVRNLPTPGDIAQALTSNPDAYTLSLGHLLDLTLTSFAYLRGPLLLAGAAFLVGALGILLTRRRPAWWALAAMMVLFLNAARWAMMTFDPYLSSKALADAYRQAPPGRLIVDNQYYTFSSVFFYANTRALLLGGRVNNLEYGSNAPGAPDVFLTDDNLRGLWPGTERLYLLAEGPAVTRLAGLVGRDNLHAVAASGGKFLFTNHAPVR